MTWRRRCQPAPIDLTGLHAVARKAKTVAKQYLTLTTEKDTLMSTPNPSQADIDADVAALTAVFTTLGTVFTDIKAELAALPTTVDTTALDALVTTGQSTLTEYQGLDTVTPPPAPPTP